jgi:hypothetical protein
MYFNLERKFTEIYEENLWSSFNSANNGTNWWFERDWSQAFRKLDVF